MPELPEVETVMRGLETAVRGKRLKSVVTQRRNLRIPFPKGLAALGGQTVTAFERRAKYILMHLSSGQAMIVHLGMSGRMTINPDEANKHDHMIMEFSDKTRVVFNDPRRFGLVDLCDKDKIHTHRLFAHLGPEPLEKIFDADYLAGALRGRKTPVKVAIMDQRIVVGVGNIYAAEALFMSRIDPRRAGGDITRAEIVLLVRAIKDVLKKAIKAGGSSLRDYVQADGELGYFQHDFAVYDRAGQKCKGCNCKKTCVQRITQGGRSTFYCPEKQR